MLPQGDWSREVKKADFPLVIKLTTEALSTKSKDLQLAAWLTEAILFRDHIAGLREGLDLLRGFMETFWDTLYPEIDDGDLEFRAGPLGLGRLQARCCRSPAASHQEQARFFQVSGIAPRRI